MTATRSRRAFEKPSGLILVLVAAAGVTLQFVASGRPLHDLTYFTILSALLLGVSTAASLSARRRQTLALIRGAATVGTVVSGLVYAVAIAPGESAGQGPWLWSDPLAAVASLTLHALLPVLAVVVFARAVRPLLPDLPPWKLAAAWTIWPTLWALGIGLGQSVGLLRVPYRFLDQSEVGLAAVLVAVAAMVVLCLGLGWGLLRLSSLRVQTSPRCSHQK